MALRTTTQNIEIDLASERYSGSDGHERRRKAHTRGKARTKEKTISDKYFVVNTSPLRPPRKCGVDPQKKALDESLSRIFDPKSKKVHFENLRYSLAELFEDQPAFNEPLPIYSQMGDFVPRKLELPIQVRNDNLETKQNKSRHDQERENNLALEDVCRVRKKTGLYVNAWVHFMDMVKNSQLTREVIMKYNKSLGNRQFSTLKRPHKPFFCVDSQQLETLRQLTAHYKKYMRHEQMQEKGVSFEDVPEPETGFIDFEKIYEWYVQDRGGLEADKNVKKNKKKDRRHDSKHAEAQPAGGA